MNNFISSNELESFFKSICRPFSEGTPYHTLKRREPLYNQGDVAKSFAYVIKGRLNVTVQHDDGDFVVASVFPKDIVGEMGLFLDEKFRTTSVIAEEETKVLVVNYEDFFDALEKNHLPLLHMAKVMAMRLSVTTKNADSIATKSVKERLILLLAELSSSSVATMCNNGDSVFKMSRKEMSLRIGCSRELAGKHLSELEDEGLISCKGMTIKVKRQMRLREGS